MAYLFYEKTEIGYGLCPEELARQLGKPSENCR